MCVGVGGWVFVLLFRGVAFECVCGWAGRCWVGGCLICCVVRGVGTYVEACMRGCWLGRD